MNSKNLLTIVDQIHAYFEPLQIDPERELLYRHLKLTEEVGELSNDLMSHLGHQRKEKLDQFDPNNLGLEVIDVVFAALLVGKSAGVDLEQAFEQKIKTMRTRFDLS